MLNQAFHRAVQILLKADASQDSLPTASIFGYWDWSWIFEEGVQIKKIMQARASCVTCLAACLKLLGAHEHGILKELAGASPSKLRKSSLPHAKDLVFAPGRSASCCNEAALQPGGICRCQLQILGR